MPVLLCLKRPSVGENSSVKQPGYIQVLSSLNKPVLHSSTRSQFLSELIMASVKSLTRSPSQSRYSSQHMSAAPFSKAYSFSEATKPQTNYSFSNRNLLSSSFDLCHKYVSMPPLLTPTRTPSNLFGSSNCRLSANVDSSMLTALESCVDSVHEEKTVPTLNISPFIFSAVAAASVTTNLTTCSQPQSSPERVVPSQSLHSVAEEIIPCSDTKSTYKLTAAENMQDSVGNTKMLHSVTSLSLPESSVVLGHSDVNVAEDSNESTDKSASSCENLSDLSFDNIQISENVSSSCNSQNCKEELKSSANDNTSHCCFKSMFNLASVLSAPRKTVRKGRPSSKKQKKRQREKLKHGSASLRPAEIFAHSQTKNGIRQIHTDSESLEFGRNLSDELDNSLNSPSSSPYDFETIHGRTPSKAPSKLCPISYLFFKPTSSMDEMDEDDNGDDVDGSSEWVVNKNKGLCISPIKSSDFNFTFNVYSKPTVLPSLKCKFGAEKNETGKNSLCQNLYQSLSEDDSLQDSNVDMSASPVSSETASCDFFIGLSLDTLFPEKVSSKNQISDNLTEPVVDWAEDLLPSDTSLLSTGHETDLETLNKINNKWNENYPTAGFRSCRSISADEIRDPNIKVHFAKEPHMLTVHVVGTEERGGTWHQFALDRERFERRILELDKVISPVLEAGHRAKILKRKQCLEDC